MSGSGEYLRWRQPEYRTRSICPLSAPRTAACSLTWLAVIAEVQHSACWRWKNGSTLAAGATSIAMMTRAKSVTLAAWLIHSRKNAVMAIKTLEEKLNALLRHAQARMPILSKKKALLEIHLTETQDLDWNEKSVEYYYARHILDDASIANPLAGDAETLFGDLITGTGTGSKAAFCVIEFKARQTDIASEFEKFLRTMSVIGKRPEKTPFSTWFSAENPNLLAQAGCKHHYLVYGAKSAGQPFGLHYGKYSENTFRPLKKFGQLAFCNAVDLTEYLCDLALARSQGPLPDGGGGTDLIAAARGQVFADIRNLLVCSDNGSVTSADELLGVFAQWMNNSDESFLDESYALAAAHFRTVHQREPDAKEKKAISKVLTCALLSTRFLKLAGSEHGEMEMVAGGHSRRKNQDASLAPSANKKANT